MSYIAAGNTTTTSLTLNADTTANLIFTTGGANTTALTLDLYQGSSFNSSIRELVTVSAANATANVNFDVITQGVLLFTANASANTTINIRGNSTVPLNNVLSTGQSVSVVLMSPQGATAYYLNTYQLDGVGVTPKWQGGAAPSAGNTNSIDTYTFAIIKTGSNAFVVLASQTKFA